MMQGYGYGPPPSMRQETPLFNAGGVQVTTARFVCWQQTYPLGGITSVAPFTHRAKKGGAYFGVIFSAAWALVWLLSLLIGGEGAAAVMMIISIGIAAACVFWLRSLKDSHGVMITTSGMNVRAVVSHDATFVHQIVSALNHALSMR